MSTQGGPYLFQPLQKLVGTLKRRGTQRWVDVGVSRNKAHYPKVASVFPFVSQTKRAKRMHPETILNNLLHLSGALTWKCCETLTGPFPQHAQHNLSGWKGQAIQSMESWLLTKPLFNTPSGVTREEHPFCLNPHMVVRADFEGAPAESSPLRTQLVLNQPSRQKMTTAEAGGELRHRFSGLAARGIRPLEGSQTRWLFQSTPAVCP